MSDELKGNWTSVQLKAKLSDLMKIKNKEIEEKNSEIDELEKKILLLEKETRELKKSNLLMSTDEGKIKKILSLYARGFTYKTIYDKMLYNGFDKNIDHVREVCTNIDDLSNDLILYYKEQVEAHEKSIETNPNLINNTLIQVLQQNINDASQDLEGLSDIKEKSNLRREIKDHAKELTALTKNIMEDSNEVFVDEQVKKIKDGLQKRNQRILKEFDPTQFKLVK
jgi:hypothetical protein